MWKKHDFPPSVNGTVFIDGAYRPGASDTTIEATDPSTGARLGAIACTSREDVEAAVSSARRAFEEATEKLRPQDRQRLLLTLADAIAQNLDYLASLQSQEMGMPFAIAKGSIGSCIEFCRYYAGWATKLYGDTIETSAPGTFHAYTIREPIGVICGIIPWNAPIPSMLYKLCPAIAAGNAIIIKPAEEASLCVHAMGDILNQSGFPPGLVNIVPGLGHETGDMLCRHPGIGKVAFTGSVETARHILQASGANMKRVTFELGGKSANIIMADADLDKAVPHAGWAVFGLTGQLCVAGTRIFVQRSIHDEFLARLTAYAQDLRVGQSHEDGVQLGPLASAAQLSRVERYLAMGCDSSIPLITGGARLTDGTLRDGYFIPPTIFADVPDQSPLAQEEIFGPVASVMTFDTPEEVVSRANDTRYGLAAGVYTRDLATAHTMAKKLQGGVVWVNCYGASDPAMSFGGTKESGYGREKGRLVLDDYTQVKSVWVGLS